MFKSSINPFNYIDGTEEPQIPINLGYLYKNIDGVIVETDVPNGVYDVVIVDVKMGTSLINEPQFIWTLRINMGKYHGHVITRYDSLYHSPESAKLCRDDLYRCGYTVENFDLLSDQGYCDQLLGIRLWILLISKGASKIYYIVRKL